MLPERTVRTIHVYKGVASVAELLETLMDETPHIFWINVCQKKSTMRSRHCGLSIEHCLVSPSLEEVSHSH